jgi:Amt family ammonium transporter
MAIAQVTPDDLTSLKDGIYAATTAGNTAWILASTALVLFMTPGLAFFYGGMSRSKSVLNMLMMSFSSIGIVSVLWVIYGYSLTFGPDQGGLIGNFDYRGLHGISTSDTFNLLDIVFVSFQMMFAVITLALISGAIADRMKFGSWVVFSVLWATLVYFPVAHWVFAFGSVASEDDLASGNVGNGAASLFTKDTGGWIVNKLGALDFAGGTAVHINAGAAALALVLVIGKRKGFGSDHMRPHNLPLVMIGTGILWFGWFGFNAGSALGASSLSGLAFVNTQVATAAAMLGWLVVERLRDGHATTLGAASGAVAGLVAITPSCGAVTPVGAIILGALAGAICAVAVTLKSKLGYDDALDVVGVHLVGGLAGTLLIGFLASDTSTGSADLRGLLYGGGGSLLGKQAVAAGAVLAYSFVVTFILGTIIKLTIGIRVSEEDEVNGIDQAEHAETAYEFGGIGGGAGSSLAASGARVDA